MAAIPLLLLGPYPMSHLEPGVEKSLFVALMSCLVLVWLGVTLLLLGKKRAEGFFSPAAAALILVPLAVLLVSLRGGLTSHEWAGIAFEPDSIFAIFVFSAWALAFFITGRRMKESLLQGALETGLVALSLSQLLGGYVPSVRALPLFGDQFSQSLAIATLLAIPLVSLIAQPLSPAREAWKVFSVFVGALALVLSPYPALQWTAAGVSLGVLLYAVLRGKEVRGDISPFQRQRSFVAYGLAALSLAAAALWGPSLAATAGFLHPPGEIRLSPGTTLGVLARLYAADSPATLFGTGAHTFAAIWNAHRPLEANRSAFFDVDQSQGYGLMPTLAATAGAPVVFLAVLLTAILIGKLLIAALRAPQLPSATAVGVAAGFSLVSLLFFPPGSAYLALAGILVGSQVRLGGPPEADSSAAGRAGEPTRYWRVLLAGGIAVLFIGIGTWGALRALDRSAAVASYFEAVVVMNAEGDLARARESLLESRRHDSFALSARTLAFIDRESARQLAAQESVGASLETLSAINVLLTEGRVAAADATRLDPSDFRNFLERAYVHTVAAFVGRDEQEMQTALDHYENAVRLAPMHPLPYFAQAQAFMLAGKLPEASAALAEALRLKPDFEPALQLEKSMQGGAGEGVGR